MEVKKTGESRNFSQEKTKPHSNVASAVLAVPVETKKLTEKRTNPTIKKDFIVSEELEKGKKGTFLYRKKIKINNIDSNFR